jgi:hypothetical protein
MTKLMAARTKSRAPCLLLPVRMSPSQSMPPIIETKDEIIILNVKHKARERGI